MELARARDFAREQQASRRQEAAEFAGAPRGERQAGQDSAEGAAVAGSAAVALKSSVMKTVKEAAPDLLRLGAAYARGESTEPQQQALAGTLASNAPELAERGAEAATEQLQPNLDEERQADFERAWARDSSARRREAGGEEPSGILRPEVAARLSKTIAAKMIEKDLEGSIIPLVISLISCAVNDFMDVITAHFPVLAQILDTVNLFVYGAVLFYLKWFRGWNVFQRIKLIIVVWLVEMIPGVGVLPFWTILAAIELLQELDRRYNLRADLHGLASRARSAVILSRFGMPKLLRAARMVRRKQQRALEEVEKESAAAAAEDEYEYA